MNLDDLLEEFKDERNGHQTDQNMATWAKQDPKPKKQTEDDIWDCFGSSSSTKQTAPKQEQSNWGSDDKYSVATQNKGPTSGHARDT